MTTFRSLRAPGLGWLTAALITLAMGAGISAETPDRPAPPSPPQAPEAPPPPPAPDVPSDTTPEDLQPERRRSMRLGPPTVRIGQDIVVRAGETAEFFRGEIVQIGVEIQIRSRQLERIGPGGFRKRDGFFDFRAGRSRLSRGRSLSRHNRRRSRCITRIATHLGRRF